MKLTPLNQPVPNPDITPDPNDKSNHCKSCDWTFASIPTYRHHLKIAHEIDKPKLQIRTWPNPDILPDVDDPNFHCKSCQSTYKNLNTYRTHTLKAYAKWS